MGFLEAEKTDRIHKRLGTSACPIRKALLYPSQYIFNRTITGIVKRIEDLWHLRRFV